jgi:hypothetical protein
MSILTCQPSGLNLSNGSVPHQAAFLFLRRPETLRAEEQETLLKLRQMSPEVDLAYDLVQQFGQMLRKRTGKLLDTWLLRWNTAIFPNSSPLRLGSRKTKIQ